MITFTEEEFIEKIIKEYEEWCGYHCECYITSDDEDEDDLFEFVMCHVPINEQGLSIEELDDEEFEEWKKFFYSIDKTKIWNCIDDYLHPYDPFREHCDADFYGI